MFEFDDIVEITAGPNRLQDIDKKVGVVVDIDSECNIYVVQVVGHSELFPCSAHEIKLILRRKNG